MAVGWDSAPLGKMCWDSALAKGTSQTRLVNVHYSSIYQSHLRLMRDLLLLKFVEEQYLPSFLQE